MKRFLCKGDCIPTIEISDDVHALMWSLARKPDETDDALLRRVLSAASEGREAAMKAYEQSEQDITSTN